MSNEPDLKSSFVYRSKTYYIDWYDIIGGNLLNLPWQQVYVIGDLNGMAPVVHYDGDENDNLPGGKTESGETVEQTIIREMDEEIKAKVVSWKPLGYQVGVNSKGNKVYQLRVYAKLIFEEKFENDPGGSVIGHSLVPIKELNKHIQWGEIGDRLVDMVQKLK